ncbi:SAF domain-containing protein [Microbacterium hydrocarbonoxydans]|uniref:SAF domain-containing protein n=1 Tax=Microbacterium hydrocarbonoxydans TaxID=273678 RepID=UPI0020401E9B|nr:SAF domain-containing protein [Microbacterium hydrocarbonoxydans]MCM3779276.1 SAF domain-containing protein [Microbacterium hydrocarbonoxydans]
MRTPSRPRRAFWGDVRFLLGLGMIAASIGGVWLVVSSAGATTPVLQATRTIAEGEAVGSDDFQVVEVNLGALGDRYLAPEDLGGGSVASRTLTADELVPASALADADSRRTTTIVIQTGTAVPGEVAAGSTVELWQSRAAEDGVEAQAPSILVEAATVASFVEKQGVLASDEAGVELVIDRSDVAAVLAAIAGGAGLSIVPIGVTR